MAVADGTLEWQALEQADAPALALRADLGDRVGELEAVLGRVRTLERMIPICAACRKVHNEQSYWQSVETYIAERSQATFTHAMCPDCIARHPRPAIEAARRRNLDAE